MKYRRLLKKDQWSRRRKEILRRDGYRCRRCGSTGRLNVHHKWYIYGRQPWDYPDRCLVTLCETCHRRVHLLRTVNYFIRLIILLAVAYLVYKNYR